MDDSILQNIDIELNQDLHPELLARARQLQQKPAGSSAASPKYKNNKVRVVLFGHEFVFDSKMEYQFYLQLQTMEDNGIISNLLLQPRFVLVERRLDEWGRRIKGRYYTADFYCIGSTGVPTVIDVKGFATQRFDLAWSVVRDKYPELKFILITKENMNDFTI